MGFYALAIATGIVGASTGLGVWVTAKLMGVDNVSQGLFSCWLLHGVELTWSSRVAAVQAPGP